MALGWRRSRGRPFSAANVVAPGRALGLAANSCPPLCVYTRALHSSDNSSFSRSNFSTAGPILPENHPATEGRPALAKSAYRAGMRLEGGAFPVTTTTRGPVIYGAQPPARRPAAEPAPSQRAIRARLDVIRRKIEALKHK